jgi:hypothetical protein
MRLSVGNSKRSYYYSSMFQPSKALRIRQLCHRAANSFVRLSQKNSYRAEFGWSSAEVIEARKQTTNNHGFKSQKRIMQVLTIADTHDAFHMMCRVYVPGSNNHTANQQYVCPRRFHYLFLFRANFNAASALPQLWLLCCRPNEE